MQPMFTADLRGDTLELCVYGPIGAGPFGDGVSADRVSRELDPYRMAGIKSLLVRINSPGGSAYDGMAIRAMLTKLTGVEKVCEIEGLAASAGSLIAMGCDKIRMHTGSALMVHEASARFDSPKNAGELQKVLSGLETLNDGMASVYAARTGMSKEDCRALMAAETWLTPEQAMAQKFCDEVVPGTAAVAAAASAFDLDAYGYRNVPAPLLAASAQQTQQPDDAGKDNTMSDFLSLIAADIGLSASAEPASVAAAVRQAISTLTDLRSECKVDSNAKLVGAVKGLMEAAALVPTLQAQVAEQNKSIMEQKRQSIFAADAADPKGRKLTPALQTFFASQPLEVLEGFMASAPHQVKVESSGQPAVQSVGPNGAALTATAEGVQTFNGKAFEAMNGIEKQALHQEHPEQYAALRDNWVSRGKPMSREQRASA